MKKLYFLTLIIAAYALMAASNGVAEVQNKDRSGSPDGDNVCSQCHSSGSFSPSIGMVATDPNSLPVTTYNPGETYLLSFAVTAADGSPAEYGFQATALDANNNNSGEFLNPGASVQLGTVNNDNVTDRKVAEHSTPSAVGVFQVEWTAPSVDENVGDVTFYYSGVAANASNNTSGDGYAGGSMVLTPNVNSVDENLFKDEFKLANSSESVSLLSNLENSNLEIKVYDLQGRAILEVLEPSFPLTIQKSDLASGINLLNITSENESTVLKVFN